MNDLIDTTEMYLRTIFELEEDGVTPLRARIAERLHQSGPTVSQTVARMQRDGLVSVEGDRHLELSDTGRKLATQVMRKHRLAERLLVDVIGLDWEDVHIEACRWEHVMSEAVERRLVALLDNPTSCPHGSPIPGLDELGWSASSAPERGITDLVLISDVATDEGIRVRIERISEQIQGDAELMHRLTDAHIRPGNSVLVARRPGGVDVDGHHLPGVAAEHIFVSLAGDVGSRSPLDP